MVKPRDIAEKAEEEWWTPEIQVGRQKKKKNGEAQTYSWEGRRSPTPLLHHQYKPRLAAAPPGGQTGTTRGDNKPLDMAVNPYTALRSSSHSDTYVPDVTAATPGSRDDV